LQQLREDEDQVRQEISVLAMRGKKPQVHVEADSKTVEECTTYSDESRWKYDHHHPRGSSFNTHGTSQSSLPVTPTLAFSRTDDSKRLTKPSAVTKSPHQSRIERRERSKLLRYESSSHTSSRFDASHAFASSNTRYNE
jgi:hypothetical protein